MGDVETNTRQKAVQFLKQKIPCRLGDDTFLDISQNRCKDFRYNSEGDVIHWFLSELGVQDHRVLNRDIPSIDLKFKEKQNMIRLKAGSERLCAWTSYRLGLDPKPGDILILGNARRFERIKSCIFISAIENNWNVVEDGIFGTDKNPSIRFNQVEFKGGNLIDSDGQKEIMGWVDIVKLTG